MEFQDHSIKKKTTTTTTGNEEEFGLFTELSALCAFELMPNLRIVLEFHEDGNVQRVKGKTLLKCINSGINEA